MTALEAAERTLSAACKCALYTPTSWVTALFTSLRRELATALMPEVLFSMRFRRPPTF